MMTYPTYSAANFKKQLRKPIVTYVIIGLCVVAYIGQLMSGTVTEQMLLYSPSVAPHTGALAHDMLLGIAYEPWRIITYAFAHDTSSFIPLHLLLNMYTLWIFGTVLEPLIGRGRYVLLYIFGIVGGALGVYALNPSTAVIGASGALFALMGALLVIQRSMGGQTVQLMVLIGINFVVGLIYGGISWQAHLGGLVIGLCFGMIVGKRGGFRTKSIQTIGFVILGLVIVTLFIIIPDLYWFTSDPPFGLLNVNSYG